MMNNTQQALDPHFIPNPHDFTHKAYYEHLENLQKQGYRFVSFSNWKEYEESSVIWRHDLDASVHRAFKLAQIEKKMGIQSTFFIMLHNEFYDIRSPEVYDLIQQIHAMGHWIGLHFDFDYIPTGSVKTLNDLEKALALQKQELEGILTIPIHNMSFHNPGSFPKEFFEQVKKEPSYAGMTNAYYQKVITEFTYRSDSHGMWRYGHLSELINSEKYPKLHILIHPEWWTEHPMTSRQKIKTILLGGAKAKLNLYDQGFAQWIGQS